MKRLPMAIIQMGDPPDEIAARAGGQAQWFAAALGEEEPVEIYRPWLDEALPEPDSVCGAIITGSWSMVTDNHPWSEVTAAWLRRAFHAGLPLFGICYGHQLMASALGGEVIFHPEGLEVGQKKVTLTEAARCDPLLANFPQQFDVFLSHYQTVKTLPQGATALATSAHDAHQIVRYAPHALSVQFHPEFTPQIMAVMLDTGHPQHHPTKALHGTPCARRLMQQVVAGWG